MFKRSFLKRLVAAAWMAALAAPVLAQEAIRIGNSSPLTGGLSYQAEQEQRAIKLALEEINGRGGVLGRKIEVVTEDNKCNPTEAVTAMSRLLERKVSAVLGAHCSTATLASMALVQNARVPMLTPIATNPKITEATGSAGNDWVFRLNPSDAMLANAIGKYISGLGTIRNVVIIAEDSDYGRGGAEAFRKVAAENRINVVSTDFFPAQQPDFTPILTRVQARNPDAIALYTQLNDQVNFMRQYQLVGLKARFTGRVELAGKNLQTLIDAGIMENASSVFPYASQLDTPENKAFVARFKARHGEEPIYAAAATYEALHVLADAIGRAGSAEPAAIQAALKKTSYRSMLGKVIGFDDKNQAHNVAIILQVRNGVVTVVATEGT